MKVMAEVHLADKVYYLNNDCKDIWDWCFDFHSFIANKETKMIAVENIIK